MKNILKFLAIFILGIFGGIFGSQILWPLLVERPLFYQYNLGQNPVYVTEKKEVIIQENTALADAIDKVGGVAVGVKTKNSQGKTVEGSGLILTSDGLAVTLADLVPQGSTLVFVAGEQVSFQILKRDLKTNLALIKLEKKDLPTAGFADPDKVKLGERVFLVGTVFDKAVIAEAVNEGVVKKISGDSIETNIIEKSNLAGSPLFDIEGNVLGLNTVDKDGRVASIPISKIKSFTGF